jgi:hypothetical protein
MLEMLSSMVLLAAVVAQGVAVVAVVAVNVEPCLIQVATHDHTEVWSHLDQTHTWCKVEVVVVGDLDLVVEVRIEPATKIGGRAQ